MRRRELISLAGFMAVACPLVTHAQQAAMKRSGVLMGVTQADAERNFQRWLPKKHYHKSQNNWDVSIDP
jgi:hypothetical protein